MVRHVGILGHRVGQRIAPPDHGRGLDTHLADLQLTRLDGKVHPLCPRCRAPRLRPDVEACNGDHQRIGLTPVFEAVGAVIARDGVAVHQPPGRILKHHVHTPDRARGRGIAHRTRNRDGLPALGPGTQGQQQKQQQREQQRQSGISKSAVHGRKVLG